MFNKLKEMQVDGKFEEEIESCRKRVGIFYNKDDDNWFYEKILFMVFENRVKTKVVQSKREAISLRLGDFRKVAQYNDKKIEELINDKDIRLWGISRKVPATKHNAQEILRIIEKYGSFRKYLESFINSEGLMRDMKKRFKEIDNTNALAFQKYVGFAPTVKPDSNVKTVLFRLGLVKSKNASWRKIRAVCQDISEAVGENLNVIDEVLWCFGSGFRMKNDKAICGRKPLCEKDESECPLTNYCQYYKNIVKKKG